MKEHNKTPGVQIYFESVTLSKIAEFFLLRSCRLITYVTSLSRVTAVGAVRISVKPPEGIMQRKV